MLDVFLPMRAIWDFLLKWIPSVPHAWDCVAFAVELFIFYTEWNSLKQNLPISSSYTLYNIMNIKEEFIIWFPYLQWNLIIKLSV